MTVEADRNGSPGEIRSTRDNEVAYHIPGSTIAKCSQTPCIFNDRESNLSI